MNFPSAQRFVLRGFSLLEMLVASAVLVLLVVLLASLNNQTLQTWSRTSAQVETFQSARLAFDGMIRQFHQATLNAFWDYDNPDAPQRYLRKSDLAFVTGRASTLLGAGFGPGQAVFFQAPMGRLADAGNRQLVQVLNTCGFFIDYGDIHVGAPDFMDLPPRNRYRLMQLQTAGEEMDVFSDRNDNAWFSGYLSDSRMLAANVVLLVIRPLASGPGGTRRDLASANYSLDTRQGETSNPQPETSNQLPPLVDITLVAVSEDSMNRRNPERGYEFSTSEINTLFTTPDDASYEADMNTFEEILLRERLDYRIFRQQIVLPNSKWSD